MKSTTHKGNGQIIADGEGRSVVVGMSGGVDSSVAASELNEAGYAVTGLFMKNWEEDDDTGYCTAKEDYDDAARVCDRLGIELRSINFATEYWDRVFTAFIDELNRGRTPNPDVVCNREIKFKEFVDWSDTLGADCIATGHYARSDRDADGPLLKRGLDRHKDQSYFLYQVEAAALAQSLFPIGHLTKPEVRRKALNLGLDVHAKKDSTGICFIGERRFRDFIRRYVRLEAGPMVSDTGKRIGTHDGLARYTIGQRQGLGIGGAGAPWYVARKYPASNELVVVQGHDHALLFDARLTATDVRLISPGGTTLPLRCTAKTRYRQEDVACEVEAGSAPSHIAVRFDQPQRALTPGQSIVFYNGDVCLGGAIIDRVGADE